MSEKPPSDVIRKVDVHDYISAHSKANGGGFRDFFKSNLFTALVIFILTQGLLVGGSMVAMWWRTASLLEWKGKAETKMAALDEAGTVYSRRKHELHDKELTEIRTRVTKVEDETEHLDVFEAENRRITAEVEKLKNEKK